MPRLAIIIHTGPGAPDQARGALDIVRSQAWEAVFPEMSLIHVHSLAHDEWPGPYYRVPEETVAARPGEVSRVERINAAVRAAEDTGADYALICESEVWPLFPRWLGNELTAMARGGKLLGAAAVDPSPKNGVPQGGLWARLFALDLNWQRARRPFPLPWDQYLAAIATRTDRWETASLNGCLSAAFFQRIAETTAPETARTLAASQLQRFAELEPVVERGHEAVLWRDIAITRDPHPNSRAELVRLRHAEQWGPTLRRLATSDDLRWFDHGHGHP